MKRWLVAVLVILALVILVSPGIIGMLAEKNIEQSVDWAVSEADGVEVRTERFDRGWFTSEGRHRIVLTDAAFPLALGDYRARTGYADLPSLIVETQVDHGPVPVGDAGSPTPGLANMLSTFQFDPGNGELVDLPGTLRSKVGLTGATDSRFLLESGEFHNETGGASWTGADIELHTDWSSGTVIVNGRVEPLTISVADEVATIGGITLAADQVAGAYGFNEGKVSLRIDSIEAESPRNPASIGGLAFDAELDVDGTRLSVASRLASEDVEVPGMGSVSFVLDLAMDRLDAAAAQAIVQRLRAAQSGPDPEQAMADMLPLMQGDVEKIMAAGAGIRIDEFNLVLPQGTLAADLKVDVAEAPDAASFSWSSALLKATASANLRVSPGLFDMFAAMNPDINAVVAMGYLARDGDDYVVHAEYAKGLLKINGAPLQVPLPAL